MPPSLTRSSLSSLYRCERSHTFSLPIRLFTTSHQPQAIGPESPKFITFPIPPQPNAKPRNTTKGTLPVPRNIFPRRAGDKTSPQYLANITPKPKKARDAKHAPDEYIAWKRRLAAQRRKNLRESLVQLHERKVKTDKFITTRSTRRRKDREARLHAPQREDERLTFSTVKAANKVLQRGPLPDPNREQRLQASIAKVKAKRDLKSQERMEALHTLYMHARSFITTEEQLKEAIEKTFTSSPFKHIPGKEYAQSIWAAEGPPPTVTDMLSQVNNTQKTAVSFHESPAVLTGKRMSKIAEELTGGKMDS